MGTSLPTFNAQTIMLTCGILVKTSRSTVPIDGSMDGCFSSIQGGTASFGRKSWGSAIHGPVNCRSSCTTTVWNCRRNTSTPSDMHFLRLGLCTCALHVTCASTCQWNDDDPPCGSCSQP